MMPEVFTREKDKADGRNGDGQGPPRMVGLARREVRYHTAPFPEAYEPEIEPFPRPVTAGLGLSALLGGLLGLGFGALLHNNLLVIPGWEGLYSMSPFTFHAFWTFMGIALGILLGGVATLLLTPTARKKD